MGFDLAHADRIIYGRDLDLGRAESVTPIGAGCKICDRANCLQRAFPLVGRPLDTDADSSRRAPCSG
ncbi:short-chain fatty acyl-CoA regulator family protein [Pseudooceanicola marinus]|uniref:short-chain fatty acyl-CoA regulator family protein n=1 Tax=Pseudooceanicola marinus TaxID=396013 RepID=UPI000A26DA93|nr:short-chain fatty acyl-CoA regulator family protein [Pseudooceanicola marinus]PJE31653.1 hypothetical protein CVM50_08040 [Pseudooceanicola marinus]